MPENEERHCVINGADREPDRKRRRIRRHPKLGQALTDAATGQSAFQRCGGDAADQGEDGRAHGDAESASEKKLSYR
jgi:hypothetical protein